MGSPVVPLLKLRKPQISLLVCPAGILKGWTWPLGPKSAPKTTRSWIEVKLSFLPSIRIIRSCEIPAFFAAGMATGRDDAAVIRTFACAVRNAKVISSTLYAGEAPEIIPPTERCYNLARLVLWNEDIQKGPLTHTIGRKHGNRIPNSVWTKKCHHVPFRKSKFMNQGSWYLYRILLSQIVPNAFLRGGICEASKTGGLILA